MRRASGTDDHREPRGEWCGESRGDIGLMCKVVRRRLQAGVQGAGRGASPCRRGRGMRVPRVIRVAPRSNLTAETPVIALRRIAPVALLLTVGTLAIACEKAERSAAMPTEQSAVMAVTEAPAPPPPAMVGDASGVLRGTDVGRGAIGSAFGTGSGNGTGGGIGGIG